MKYLLAIFFLFAITSIPFSFGEEIPELFTEVSSQVTVDSLDLSSVRNSDISKQTSNQLQVNLNAFDSDGVTQYKPPLRQIRDDGVSPKDVQCNEGKVLVFKNSNGSPLCIYFDSVIKLEKSNYLFVDYDRVLDQTIDAKCITDKNEIKIFPLRYSIENAEIISIEKDNPPYYLDIYINSQDYGSLYIELPRKFMHSITVTDSGDQDFATFLDKEGIDNLETQTTKDSRTLKINFKLDTNLITVVETLPTHQWGMNTCGM